MVIKSTRLPIPPLQNGDHLTADEFERRYHAMPSNIKAELIEGVVYMSSPVRVEYHGEPHGDLLAWFGLYRASTPGVRSPVNSTIRFGTNNQPQPDAALMIAPEKGGQAEIDELGYLKKSPELLAEISASTADYDLYEKREMYCRHGVLEYLVWRVLDEEIDWFVLRNDSYERLQTDAEGILKSEAFPGLWLDSAALLKGDLAAVFAVVQRGLATPEHAEFVKRLTR